MSGKNCLVSIIVTTYNRADMLGDALKSLIALEIDGHIFYEILVIDDASTDYTGDVVESIRCISDVPIRYYIEDGKGVARARNRGIKETSGEWVVFFDDDQIAEICWLKELLAATEKIGTLCVGGQVRLLFPEKNSAELPEFCRGLLGETHHGNSLKKFTNKILPATNNVMINRTIFNTIGFFNESMIHGSEDAEFFRRTREAGFEMWYAPNALIYHITPSYRLTKKYLTWTSLRHGVSYAFIDYNEHGLKKVVSVCILRMAQAILITGLHFLNAWLHHEDKKQLQATCLILRAIGYLRETFFLLSPKTFPQSSFYKHIRFRQKRNMFSTWG